MQIRDSFLTSLGSASLPPSGRQAPSAINPIVLPAITGEIPVLGSVLLVLLGLPRAQRVRAAASTSTRFSSSAAVTSAAAASRANGDCCVA
ncbi:MAG: hypothetical protein QNJ91_00950 [Gammaproteobacteria bacterium]|nr:hypothetical protein [Gammaproteobacteria bacterium]